MIDEEVLRLRIRHFLLQQSLLYQRAIAKNSKDLPSLSAMANELSKIIPMTARRLQKYLNKNLPPKEIAISLEDIGALSHLKKTSPSQFLSYLMEEKSGYQKKDDDMLTRFFDSLHEGQRRSLKATIFSGKNEEKSERLIDLILTCYSLSENNLSIIETIAAALHAKKS